MCQCTPSIRTPWCMKGDCKPPKQLESEKYSADKMPCVYVFVNKGLNMTKGKAIAQGIHASMMSTIDAHDSARQFWLNSMQRTVLVMEARDSEHIRSIETYLKQRKFKTYLIIDEGVNEIDPHAPTALATGILDKNDEKVIATLRSFDLYRDKVRIIAEIDI